MKYYAVAPYSAHAMRGHLVSVSKRWQRRVAAGARVPALTRGDLGFKFKKKRMAALF